MDDSHSFGNMIAQTVPKGTAPSWTRRASGATNRLAEFGYDATGNVTWMPNATGYEYFEHDAENRLVRAATGGEPWVRYRYGLDNRRLWRAVYVRDGDYREEAFFYGAYGELLDGGRIYFGGRLIGRGGYVGEAVLTDRLAPVGGPGKYYPYGQERQTPPQDTEKLATYTVTRPAWTTPGTATTPRPGAASCWPTRTSPPTP